MYVILVVVIVLAVIIVISSSDQQLAFAQTSSEPATMLESNSDQGSFRVKVKWTQTGNGSTNTFNVQFIEPETGKQLEDIVYDFILVSASGNEVVHRTAQPSTSNQTATLPVAGPYIIRIANIDGLGENAEFHVRVTPEFSPVLIVAAAGFALGALFGTKPRKEL